MIFIIGKTGDIIRYFVQQLIFVLSYCYFIFYHTFSYNYRPEVVLNYRTLSLAYACMLVVLVVSIFLSTQSVRTFFLKSSALTVALLIGFLQRESNEHASNMLSLVILMICLCMLSDKPVPKTLFPWTIVFIHLIEISVGIFQLLGSEAGERLYAITGTLKNSGIFSIYLVANLPLIYFFLVQDPPLKGTRGHNINRFGRKGVLLFAAVFVATAVLVIMAQSRTAVISIIVASLLLASHYSGLSLRSFFTLKSWPVYVAVLVAGIIIILTLGIDPVKQMSYHGRELIWKISLRNWREGLWDGLGIGRFSYYYPQWQSAYFKDQILFNRAEFLAAGENYLAFNEFINYWKELGLIGSASILLLIALFYNARSSDGSNMLYFAKLSFTLVLISSLFSYPLHCMPIMFFMLFLGMYGLSSDQRYNNILRNCGFECRKLNLLICFGLLIFTLPKALETDGKARNFNKFLAARSVHLLLAPDVIKKIDFSLKDDPKFLIMRADQFLSYQKYDKAIDLSMKALSDDQSVFVYEVLGKAYMGKHRFGEAAACFNFLSKTVPSKFYFRELLMDSYLKANKYKRTREIAKQILTIPVKKPSFEVDKIKYRAETVIDSIDKKLKGIAE